MNRKPITQANGSGLNWLGMKNKILYYGIMCEGLIFHAWEAECLKRLIEFEDIEARLLIVDARVGRPSTHITHWKNSLKMVISKKGWWDIFYKFMVVPKTDAMQPVDLSEKLGHIEQIHCTPTCQGTSSGFFLERDLQLLSTHDLDFILHFGFGDIHGEILKIPRYGVWSFCHGDPEKHRDAPLGFWEVYYGEATTRVVLKKLTDHHDCKKFLVDGYFGTIPYSYRLNLNEVCFGITEWPAKICKEIIAGTANYLDANPA
jgi:hypothetical protein